VGSAWNGEDPVEVAKSELLVFKVQNDVDLILAEEFFSGETLSVPKFIPCAINLVVNFLYVF
jgi:hypothetical protein